MLYGSDVRLCALHLRPVIGTVRFSQFQRRIHFQLRTVLHIFQIARSRQRVMLRCVKERAVRENHL